MMSLGGWCDALATASSAPMPSFSMSLRSSTSTCSLNSRASFFASSAR